MRWVIYFVSKDDNAIGVLVPGAILASKLCAHVNIVNGLPSLDGLDRYGWRNADNRSWRSSISCWLDMPFLCNQRHADQVG
jgi:hypothetical protein